MSTKPNPVVTKCGSAGDVVALDQMLLYVAYKHPNPENVDGKYGENTEKETLKFQREHNETRCLKPGDPGYLEEDGKIGNYNGKNAGTGTREALIRNAQRSLGLTDDGKMSPELFDKMVEKYNEMGETGNSNRSKLTPAQIASAQRGSMVIAAAAIGRDEPQRGECREEASTAGAAMRNFLGSSPAALAKRN